MIYFYEVYRRRISVTPPSAILFSGGREIAITSRHHRITRNPCNSYHCTDCSLYPWPKSPEKTGRAAGRN